MRILGVSEKWPKFRKPRWTSFRFARKDKDRQVDEVVQVVYKSRSKKNRELLGIAKILSKKPRKMQLLSLLKYPPCPRVTDAEAIADGFTSRTTMIQWLRKRYGNRIFHEPMNKLTLEWIEFKVVS